MKGVMGDGNHQHTHADYTHKCPTQQRGPSRASCLAALWSTGPQMPQNRPQIPTLRNHKLCFSSKILHKSEKLKWKSLRQMTPQTQSELNFSAGVLLI